MLSISTTVLEYILHETHPRSICSPSSYPFFSGSCRSCKKAAGERRDKKECKREVLPGQIRFFRQRPTYAKKSGVLFKRKRIRIRSSLRREYLFSVATLASSEGREERAEKWGGKKRGNILKGRGKGRRGRKLFRLISAAADRRRRKLKSALADMGAGEERSRVREFAGNRISSFESSSAGFPGKGGGGGKRVNPRK